MLGIASSMVVGVASAAATGTISTQLCAIVNTIRGVIGILALLLFIAGGALYAVAHVMPAAGNLKGNLQGWSLGMIVGGIVGLIIVLVAPWLLGSIVNFATGTTITIPKC
ncbi:MAG: hypothetical protein KGI00_04445 [Candidatus Micrarchaeota archaeon]|nr:hypothetical protein [Candidatus Micrarchaeota archaeon]MDE1849949.1 hypothetical protein [Candidatus Micrarchaeota archaeon]